jgi:glycosyltransferase involved in cell wall biosynthesis
MPGPLYQYTKNLLFNKSDLRLVMTLLVRNEEDIIEDNIRFHARMGVDAFVIMDNASDDRTPEIVDELAKEFEMIVLHEPSNMYQQRQWVTKLAKIARTKLGADWVASNDADEFWVPRSGSLKTGLDRKGSVIRCPRQNMLLSKSLVESGDPFYDSILKVRNPIAWGKDLNEFEDTMSLYIRKVARNVMVNPHGLIRVLSGNHSALHIMRPINRRWSENVVVYHYPLRSYDRFLKKVEDRRAVLQTPGLKRVLRPRNYKWVEMLENGTLENEFNKFLLPDEDIAFLKKYGILEEDTFGRDTIARILGR